MSIELPTIGAREDLETEFKRAEVLRTKDGRKKLLRAVVAMRNSHGGRIWVGLREQDEKLVGLDALCADDRVLVQALRDQIVDSIEPMVLVGHDVRLVEVDVGGDWVLCILVERAEPPPYYCVASGSGREFLMRADGRTVTLPFERLFGGAARIPTLKEGVRAAHREWAGEFASTAALVLTSVPDGARDDHEEVVFPPSWKDIVAHPSSEIARSGGWTWHPGPHGVPRVLRAVFELHQERAYRCLRLYSTGRLHFVTALQHLTWKKNDRVSEALGREPMGQLYPYAVVETIASVVRLASSLERERASGTRYGFMVSLESARGWVLPKYGPDQWGWSTRADERAAWVEVGSPSVDSGVLVRPSDRLRDEPDSISYELIRRILESDPQGSEEVRSIPWFSDERTFSPPL